MTDATGQPAPEAQHPAEPTPIPPVGGAPVASSAPAVPGTPEVPGAPEADTEVATVYTSGKVSVRRSPRYWRFLIIGVFVGIVVALILTFAFPANPDYSLTQVFGFLLLVSGVVFGALALFIGLIIDRSMTKRMKIVAADRVDVHPAGPHPTDAAPADADAAEPGEAGPPNPPLAEGSGRS